ncbi:hypothetical protein L2E82_40442 [Cichorium intybus]|uniref:Uncharacterized protein n=1 Tax=Cichorium intybus TaxID=13427 RepID=A0ACB9ALC8_CICIN|nr:hypothetical protein L2E82_40442 [Cichorium intybus]
MLKAPLHTSRLSRTRWFNRLYTLIQTIAIIVLLYRHFCNLIYSPSFTTVFLLVADLVLAFLWLTWQAFFLNPVRRQVFPNNLAQVAKESEYPGLDIFVCTADPFKEPPIGVINTVLSVLAYDYPPEKLSVYLSDDGGSQLTLFAFMEAAKFARHWLPYCKDYNLKERSPEVHFRNDASYDDDTFELKEMYNEMKATIKNAVDRGAFDPDQMNHDHTIKAFSKWTPGFTRHDHPTVIEVLLKNNNDKDVIGHYMPNLFYISREKNKSKPHHSKAGALNTLIRVSSVMTNAPIFLTLDCDMHSNDPKTPLNTLCYFLGPNADPKLAFVQYPQRFHNINRNDTYAAEHVLETRVCTVGMDGLGGTIFMGSGGFFRRQALIEHLKDSQPIRNEPIQTKYNLELAHHVASCSYEDNTKWGDEIGFRYGTLVEDIYTSFHLHCLGWQSVTCDPTRAAFRGNMPIALNDFLNQSNRWYMGMLQAALSKYSPMTYGMKFMNPLHALCYTHYLFRAFWSIPVLIYAFVPQLALVNATSIFPKVSDSWFSWFSLYAFLFLGAYGKDFIDYMMAGSTIIRWWNHQRMWLILGCSSYPFSMFDWLLTSLGMSTIEFNVTSKVSDREISYRYRQGVFEFGVESPLLLSATIASIVNLFAFLIGIKHVLTNNEMLEELFIQLFIAGFAVLNSLPIYIAMVLRSDKGKMPTRTTLKSVCVALVIYLVFFLTL